MPMNNGAALKITTARYFTPSGRSIQAEGIEPDIIVEQLELSKKDDDEAVQRLREADLRDHLDNGNGKKSDKSSKEDKSGKNEDDDEEDITKNDYQLNEALNLLKGVNIVRQNK